MKAFAFLVDLLTDSNEFASAFTDWSNGHDQDPAILYGNPVDAFARSLIEAAASDLAAAEAVPAAG